LTSRSTSVEAAYTLLDEGEAGRRAVQGDRSVCRVEGVGVAASGEPGRRRVASRRTLLGWAATAVGLAASVQVTTAPAAQAVSSPALPVRPESAGARLDRAVEAKVSRNAVALTIDDGPHPMWTPRVLDVLAANGVHATFSLIGRQARAYPGLVRRIVGGGHGLCNHSMTHPQPFAARGTVAIRQQIVDAQSAISDAAGRQPRLFRAPGGDWTPAVLDLTAELGLTPVGWSVDPRDWTRPGIGTIEGSLLRARAGDILLTHDGGGNRAQTVAALKAVLPQLRAEGLRFRVL
jgi:peptidoglycan/xylan/chitin deacetylase (PgdA/CDA1 family)